MKSDSVGRVRGLLRQRVATHVAPYRALLLAFSGGLDSTVLLDTLTALRDGKGIQHGAAVPVLRAVHVHHGLSRYADYWADHCAHECRQRNVAFSIVRVVLTSTPNGVEAAARSARYRVLTATLTKDEVLLTAQHQDDQAETLLLALKRGSGPAGLAGMAADASFCGRRLVRPLLDCSREELETYARICGLRWIEDESNSNLRFDRNFLRARILPLLQERWPQFAAAAARSAQLCAEQERLLDELLEETLKELIQADGSLRLTALTKMSSARRAAILRRWLAGCGMRMPSRQQLARLWQEVALSRRDEVAQMHLDNRQVRRFRDRLYVLPRLSVFFNGVVTLPWPTENNKVTLPQGLGSLLRRLVDVDDSLLGGNNSRSLIVSPKRVSPLGRHIDSNSIITSIETRASISTSANIAVDNACIDDKVFGDADAISTDSLVVFEAIVRAPLPDEQVSVRFGPVSGLLYITGRRRGRTLKKIWQELEIPPWRRGSTPLLFYNDQLIAALGVFITWEGAARESEAQWHLFWRIS